jgi:hypothetical protein
LYRPKLQRRGAAAESGGLCGLAKRPVMKYQNRLPRVLSLLGVRTFRRMPLSAYTGIVARFEQRKIRLG